MSFTHVDNWMFFPFLAKLLFTLCTYSFLRLLVRWIQVLQTKRKILLTHLDLSLHKHYAARFAKWITVSLHCSFLHHRVRMLPTSFETDTRCFGAEKILWISLTTEVTTGNAQPTQANFAFRSTQLAFP